MGDHAISVRGLTKRFGAGRGARTVLDQVDLDVDRNQMVAILGRSGTGKSTLLHLIGGLDRPDTGAITVAGTRVDQLDESGLTELRRHRVGFVFQFFHLLPELTGRENVCLPMRLAGDGRAGAARADQLIARLAVAHVAGELPTTMSGGDDMEAAQLADRVMALRDGRLEAE
jgi:ABC-type lipoprotein export system ATPase subunit